MSLLCRQAWGRLACLAILAAIAGVLAACGAGPGAKQSEPVKIQEVVFEKVGTDDVKIPLGDKFSGSELTYTATSSDKAVATVAIDNDDDILTVTAIGAGEATITVTAADSQDRTASQTFKVTVKATTSEPEPGAPTVRTGAPGSFDVDQGDTQTVTLSRVFTGEDLEFTVASNDTDVATASEDAGILTITARSPGVATITVTATNDDGNAAHRITVTVPTPVTATPEPETPTTNNPSNCPSPLTIKLADGSAKCTLPKGHTLGQPAGGGLTVRRSDDRETGNVWLIVVHKRGRYTIPILSSAPEKVSEIIVVVPNTSPVRIYGEGQNLEVEVDTSKPAAKTVNLASYFTDADEDTTTDEKEDPLRFRISNKDDWILIETKDGFIVPEDGSTLTLEVLKKVDQDGEGENFASVSIYAVDTEGDESQAPVTLKIKAPAALTPAPGSYTATQTENGDFRAKNGDLIETALKVGPRRGVKHTLEFTDTRTGFAFANSKYAALVRADRVPATAVSTTLLCKRGKDYFDYTCAGSAQDPPTMIGNTYYVLESRDAVVAEWAGVTLASDPMVKFTLKDKGNSGTITVRYYVVPAATPGSTDSNDPAASAQSVSEDLRVNVVTCSSPPDQIKDCP